MAFRPAPVLGDVRDDPSASSLIRAREVVHVLASASRLSPLARDDHPRRERGTRPSSIPSARPSRREGRHLRDRLERAGEPMPRGSTTIRLPRRPAIVAGERLDRDAVSRSRHLARGRGGRFHHPAPAPRLAASRRRRVDAGRPSRAVASPRRRRATTITLRFGTTIRLASRDATRLAVSVAAARAKPRHARERSNAG